MSGLERESGKDHEVSKEIQNHLPDWAVQVLRLRQRAGKTQTESKTEVDESSTER
ncbi:MAG: hypothetical protein ACE5KO_02045 [Candidatus Bathyarchaeia archaeon]